MFIMISAFIISPLSFYDCYSIDKDTESNTMNRVMGMSLLYALATHIATRMKEHNDGVLLITNLLLCSGVSLSLGWVVLLQTLADPSLYV